MFSAEAVIRQSDGREVAHSDASRQARDADWSRPLQDLVVNNQDDPLYTDLKTRGARRAYATNSGSTPTTGN